MMFKHSFEKTFSQLSLDYVVTNIIQDYKHEIFFFLTAICAPAAFFKSKLLHILLNHFVESMELIFNSLKPLLSMDLNTFLMKQKCSTINPLKLLRLRNTPILLFFKKIINKSFTSKVTILTLKPFFCLAFLTTKFTTQYSIR